MDTSEYILEHKLVAAKTKCSLFGPKQFVYFYLLYTSKANWDISTDTPHYDHRCKCYKKDLNKLFPIEIGMAKREILNTIRIKNIIEINEPIQKPFNLMDYKNIQIKDSDWRD